VRRRINLRQFGVVMVQRVLMRDGHL
jgi:hypothetical protein